MALGLIRMSVAATGATEIMIFYGKSSLLQAFWKTNWKDDKRNYTFNILPLKYSFCPHTTMRASGLNESFPENVVIPHRSCDLIGLPPLNHGQQLPVKFHKTVHIALFQHPAGSFVPAGQR